MKIGASPELLVLHSLFRTEAGLILEKNWVIYPVFYNQQLTGGSLIKTNSCCAANVPHVLKRFPENWNQGMPHFLIHTAVMTSQSELP